MNYGKAIRIARAMSKMQQRDVAERSNLDSSYISLIEMGKRKPSEAAIDSLCKAFDIPRPLFDLLASDEEDLDSSNPTQIQGLVRELLGLLTHGEGVK